MTPKQKRRLETLSLNIRALHGIVSADYVATELSTLAAESLPKCATCSKARRNVFGSLRCEVALPPGTVTVSDDFGCVRHSEYES